MLSNSPNIDITTEGWIMCPEENCNCFQTWSVNYNADNNLKDENKENKLKRVFKRLFK
jgi:hypothetical protein